MKPSTISSTLQILSGPQVDVGANGHAVWLFASAHPNCVTAGRGYRRSWVPSGPAVISAQHRLNHTNAQEMGRQACKQKGTKQTSVHVHGSQILQCEPRGKKQKVKRVAGPRREIVGWCMPCAHQPGLLRPKLVPAIVLLVVGRQTGSGIQHVDFILPSMAHEKAPSRVSGSPSPPAPNHHRTFVSTAAVSLSLSAPLAQIS